MRAGYVLYRALVPSVDDAVTMYEASGGHLSHESLFPLSQHPQEQRYRIRDFNIRYNSFDAIYHNVVSGNGEEFKSYSLYFRHLTLQYARTLTR